MPKNGFDVPSDFTSFEEEANRARFNDRGGQHNITINGRHSDVRSYAVREETRRLPGGNDSLQSVSYKQSVNSGIGDTFNSEARAELISVQDGKQYRLVGHSNGQTLLHSTNLSTGAAVSVNITEIGAENGITANSIRSAQKFIASDGEVNRDEQEQIIRMIRSAKSFAHVL